MRNFSRFFWLFCVFMSPATWMQVHAEVECSSEVFYTWTKQVGGEETSGEAHNEDMPTDAPSPATDTGKAGSPLPAGSPDGAKESRHGQTVRFFLAQRRGLDEAAAKNALQLEVQRQKARAAERCKRAHESTGECLTTKLSIKSSTLNSLSFSARAQAEKAILEECQVQQGRCLSVDASATTCRDLVAAGPAVETSGTKGKEAGAAKPDGKAKEKDKDKDKAPTKKK
jgi:hypothetical protein